MKPTTQTFQPTSRHAGERPALKRNSGFPLTDYHFKTSDFPSVTPGISRIHASLPESRQPFRDLSKHFLGAETKRSYAVEAGLFALIVAISAWPVASMVQALMQFGR